MTIGKLALIGIGAAALVSATNPPLRFVDYPTAITKTPRPALILKRGDLDFRTRLRELYKQPVNYAGHYVVGVVGCGTYCSFLLVADVRTGRTVDLKVPSGEDVYVCDDKFADRNGEVPGAQNGKFHFRSNSRLFVVTGQMPGNDCGARYFVETNGRMVLIADIHLKAKR